MKHHFLPERLSSWFLAPVLLMLALPVLGAGQLSTARPGAGAAPSVLPSGPSVLAPEFLLDTQGRDQALAQALGNYWATNVEETAPVLATLAPGGPADLPLDSEVLLDRTPGAWGTALEAGLANQGQVLEEAFLFRFGPQGDLAVEEGLPVFPSGENPGRFHQGLTRPELENRSVEDLARELTEALLADSRFQEGLATGLWDSWGLVSRLYRAPEQGDYPYWEHVLLFWGSQD